MVSRRHLLAHGTDPKDIARAVRQGRLAVIRRGWYQTADADDAVTSAVRRGGVVSCVSALERHGIWVPPGIDRTHVRVSHFARSARPGDSCTGFGRLPTPERAVDPILPALACAAKCLPWDHFVAACDSVLHQNRAWELVDLVPAVASAPPRVRSLLDRVDRLADSGTESLVRVRLRSKRVRLTIQVYIPGVGTVDTLIGRSLIVECDSRAHHLGEGYQTDRARDRAARRLGYHPVRLTWEDVMFRWPEAEREILDMIRMGLHRQRVRSGHQPCSEDVYPAI